MFGYSKRKQDKSEPLKVEDLHRMVRDGLLYDKNLVNHFNNIESMILPFLKNKKEEEQQVCEDRYIIDKKVNKTLELYEGNKRIIILIAYSKEKSMELKSLFTNENDSIKRKLEQPSLNYGKIRQSGWSLETLDQGKIIEGKFVRVQNEDKIIDLYNDGTLIFAGRADEYFLAWPSEDGLSINPLALVELVYNFVSFYHEVVNDFNIKPNSILLEFKFLHMHINDKKSYLRRGPIDAPFKGEKYEAPQDSYSIETPLNVNVKDFDDGKATEIAYKIIEKIYLWFGIPLDIGNIPYTTKVNSVLSIDIEQIKNQ